MTYYNFHVVRASTSNRGISLRFDMYVYLGVKKFWSDLRELIG